MDQITRHAWAAGFLDGDGCFCMYRSSRNAGETTRTVSISAGNNSIAPLEELQSLFGGRVHLSHRTSAGNDHWQWHLNDSKMVKEAITKLLPFLIDKQEIASVVLAYSITIKGRGRRALTSDEIDDRAVLIEQYEELRS